MDARSRKWLADLVAFSQRIADRIDGRTVEDYLRDDDLRDIVERNLLKVGELLVRLRHRDEDLIEPIRDYRGLIALRNIMSHDYESISDAEVWEKLVAYLPDLIADAERILESDGAGTGPDAGAPPPLE